MILVINSGSSSIKFQLYKIIAENNFQVIAKGLAERIDIDGKITISYNDNKISEVRALGSHEVAANAILEMLKENNIIKDFNQIKGVGHRIVHGGDQITNSTIVDDNIKNIIAECSKLAPLHNPAGLNAVEAFQKVTSCDHVAVFDTTFHMTVPKINYIYPVPYSWYTEHKVRKYGFHGISYQYIIKELAKILKCNDSEINAIICHLGNGASICAVKNGVSYNTSMGLTPLAGLMMGTRSGDIDPSIHNYIAEQLNYDIAKITEILNKESGLLGVSDISSDMREVTTAAEEGSEQAAFTLDLYVKRIVDFIAQYQNDLDNKIDALVFTGGIGENAAVIREMILQNVRSLRLSYDKNANASKYHNYLEISDNDSAVKIFAIRTNEELMICEETYRLIK